MNYWLRLLWIVLIILLLVLAAIVIGKPTPADAQGLVTETASWLRMDEAEIMFCMVGADKDYVKVTMYIYPWVGLKGMPLYLELEYSRTNGNCHFYTAPFKPGNLGLYHADSYYSRGGGNLIYEHDAARLARVWLPMAFYSGALASRP